MNRKKSEEEATDFYRVTLWDAMAEHAAQLDKGTRVVVIGRQEQRTFQDKDGQNRQSWEVTAYSFGPDLRWATAVVTRAASGGGQRQSPAQDEPWSTPGSSSGGWGDDSSPF